MSYDDTIGIKGNLFGQVVSEPEAEIVLLPVPWDLTTSFHKGTSEGPEAIRDISYQLDFCHPDFKTLSIKDIALSTQTLTLKTLNQTLLPVSASVISHLESGLELTDSVESDILRVNHACEQMVNTVYQTALAYIQSDQLLGLVGGDHSTSLGLIRALSESVEDGFGVLQIDAHMDLRESYQGFTYSHASIMHHVLKLSSVQRVVQVGIRDYSEEELQVMKQSSGRVKTFFDSEIHDHLFEGKSFESLCKKIVNALPDKVYLTVDIDGLDPSLSPKTGTPVPGGLSFQQLSFLLKLLVKSGRQIIGFDLVEVSPDFSSFWDQTVGARVLYLLCGYAWESNQ